jgi:hypothetical protein
MSEEITINALTDPDTGEIRDIGQSRLNAWQRYGSLGAGDG